MLVLSRRPGERIVIGDGITIKVLRAENGTVRLGIEAPHYIPIWRDEVAPREVLRELPTKRVMDPVSSSLE